MKRFSCVGPCWTWDCECSKHDGKLVDPRPGSPWFPPFHKDCTCVLEEIDMTLKEKLEGVKVSRIPGFVPGDCWADNVESFLEQLLEVLDLAVQVPVVTPVTYVPLTGCAVRNALQTAQDLHARDCPICKEAT